MARNESSFDYARDLFTSAAIAAPIAYGGYKWWQATDFKSIISSSRISSSNSPYQKAFEAVQSAIGQKVPTRFSSIGKIDSLLASNILLSPGEMRESILRTAKNADKTGTTWNLFESRLTKNPTNASQLLEDIKQIANDTDSLYVQRTISSFTEHTRLFNSRAVAGMSTSLFALQTPFSVKSMNIKLGQLNQRGGLASSIQNIATSLGANFKLEGFARPDVPEGKLLKASFRLSGSGKPLDVNLNIPLSGIENPNVVYGGQAQQSKYIAGQFFEVERGATGQFELRRRMRYEEWAVHRFNEEYLPKIMADKRITQRQINSILHEYHQSISKPLQWVNDLPPGTHAGAEEYLSARQQVAHLYRSGGGKLSQFDYGDIVGEGLVEKGGITHVYPGASPTQIAAHTVSTIDWAASGATEWGRRPLQYLREDFSPTSSAIREMNLNNPLMKDFDWARKGVGVNTPLVRALYVPESKAGLLATMGLNIEGGAFMSEHMKSQYAQKDIFRAKVASDQLLDLADFIKDKQDQTTWEGGGKFFPRGSVLGLSPEGHPVKLAKDINLLQIRRVSDKNMGDYLQVKGTTNIEDMIAFKGFGGTKAMVTFKPETEIGKVVQALGLKTGEMEPINTLIPAGELRKNRQLHYDQMFTALYEFSKQNMAGGKSRNTIASNFLANPAEMRAAWEKAAEIEGKFNHEYMLAQIFKGARSAKLTPKQMGGVFGAVPDVFGYDKDFFSAHLWSPGWSKTMRGYGVAASKLYPEEMKEILRGTPTGITQVFFAGEYGPGAGKMGTIEPRAIELLSSPHMGELGPMLQKEVVSRMQYMNPERMAEQRELGLSISSLLHPKGKAGISSIDPITGGLLHLKNIGDISIPGQAQLSQLASYRTAGGEYIQPELDKRYQEFLEDAGKYNAGQLSKEEMRASMTNLAQEASLARVGTVTGKGGLARGKLLGSRFLTALPEGSIETALGGPLMPGEAGITAPMAKEMFEELEGLKGAREVEEVRERFFKGEAVGGVTKRHPFISPYSTQPARFRLIKGDKPYAIFQEAFAKASMAGQDLGTVRLGSAIGHAMDYDADNAIAMMLTGAEERAAKLATLDDDYYAYTVRNQLIKAKKSTGGTLASAEARKAAALKLSIPETNLGLISESLQTARAAVLSNQIGMTKQRSMNALGLLEWFEQTPIAGKHIQPGKEKQTIFNLTNIQSSIQSGNVKNIITSARSIASDTGNLFLEQGGLVNLRTTKGSFDLNVPGIGLETAAGDIAQSVRSFNTPNPEGITPARLRQMYRGRAKDLSEREMSALLNTEARGESAFSGLFKPIEEPGFMAKASRKASVVRNKVGSMGKSMIEHARPLGLGFAAALGVATLLSAPPKSLGHIDQSPPRPNFKSGTGGEFIDTDINPQDHISGRPTAQNLVSTGNTARVTSAGTDLFVRGVSNGKANFAAINQGIQRVIGNNGQVNSEIKDFRSSMTPQRISDLMTRG